MDFSMPSSFLSIVDGAGCILETDRLGRPPAFICTVQVEYLFQIGFKIGEISRMFLVHRTTLWRRLKHEEKNLIRHTIINDTELMSVMRGIVNSQPHSGVNMMIGEKSKKYKCATVASELNSENILIDGIEQYGIDPHVDDVPTHNEDIGSCDMLNMQPGHADLHDLLSQVDPLSPSYEHGVDVYLATREIVRHDDV
ncbi:unnamed protein product [Mytilus coruscus]|uniref:Uncharacterized protein n=1 Tax=Mytilus coruscus TaxID=42192 RepID=A0A6J8AK32_MYTCO|nr:unnamed protein product [Mytilus coruscus]